MMQPLLFTACDTGSANYLLPVLNRLSESYIIFAQGNAAQVFRNNGIDCEEVTPNPVSDLLAWGETLLKGRAFSKIISGNAWGASVDKAVTLAAKKNNISCIGIVEHWGRYLERFSLLEAGQIRQPYLYLPDRVWVNDVYAKEDAIKDGLPEERLLEAGQPFLEFQYHSFLSYPRIPFNNNIVFISERIQEDYVEGGTLGKDTNEYTALEVIVGAINFSKHRLLIKLHPQENPDKYDFLKERGIEYEAVQQCNLTELILGSYKIVGVVSMLLLETALVRNDVVSILPEKDADCFIGNKIEATRCISTSEKLREYLLEAPSPIGHSHFGKRFLGSTEKVVNMIEAEF